MKSMSTMRNWRIFLSVVMIMLSAGTAIGQNIIEVTTQVVPPYDGSFTNFHTKVLVTIRNTSRSTFTIQLLGTLTSNNVSLTFPSGRVPDIVMTGNQVLQLTQTQLKPYFEQQNVTVSGITKDELYNGNGLPPGNYQF
jgi:hypothetical protein